MRLSSLQYFQSGQTTMQKLQSELIKTQEEISSGVKVQKPSDDPANIFRALSAERGIQEFEQYNRNTIFAQNKFEQMDTYMKNFSEVLLTVKDTLVQAGGGTNSESDYENFALVLREAFNEMQSIMNSQDVDGKYIFSGVRETTKPYDVDSDFLFQGEKNEVGDSAGNLIQISKDVFVDTGIVGDDLFTIATDPTTDEDYNVLHAMEDLMTIFESGQAKQNRPAIADLTEALNFVFDKVELGRSTVGIRMNTIDKVSAANLAVRDSYEEIKSEAVDVDLNEAISRLMAGKSQLEATQLTYSQTSKLSLFNFIA